jgi:ribonuclease E
MAARMLIDAAHPEETRVAVIDGDRVGDFDFEAATRQQLKGNIYLAKVTRVEPSLQAAFVEYGGNRHGFLAFSEIHPDYYQIPIEDRQALIEDEARADGGSDEAEPASNDAPAAASDGDGRGAANPDPGALPPTDSAAADEVEVDNTVEDIGGDDYEDAALARKRRQRRRYKIQEVIKRRQVILVQVVKEERGNKGAAMTTYLSLAGRYCVLMPNTWRGGGISRRIVSGSDRSRLKSIVEGLEIPEGMSLIVRTAGLSRSKTEIKRDFDYLLKLWDAVRERTMESTAPELVYEEASLIKRSIRDLYSRDITEVLVEGEEGYKTAKTFMRQLMPSHAKNVQRYDDKIPLFQRYKVEQQLDLMHSPVVHLPSGASIVISPTEALVAVDVNSGRATRERNIEETALKTNLEAAEEVARQLRLRDLAGLIVIDFIDMDVGRHIRAVERRLKDLLKSDRARIQVGRISAFGLLEMSRQRLRPSFLETSTIPCTHCGGAGVVRSTSSTALHMLRLIEDEATQGRSSEIRLEVATAPAVYLLNEKRRALGTIEANYRVRIIISADDSLFAPAYRLERVARRRDEEEDAAPNIETPIQTQVEVKAAVAKKTAATADEDQEPKKRRRRGKRGGRGRTRTASDDQPTTEAAAGGNGSAPTGQTDAMEVDETPAIEVRAANGQSSTETQPAAEADSGESTERKPRRRRRPRRRKSAEEVAAAADTTARSVAGEGAADDVIVQTAIDTQAATHPEDAPAMIEPADLEAPVVGTPSPITVPAWPPATAARPTIVEDSPSLMDDTDVTDEEDREASPEAVSPTSSDVRGGEADDGDPTSPMTPKDSLPTAKKSRRLGWWRRSAE